MQCEKEYKAHLDVSGLGDGVFMNHDGIAEVHILLPTHPLSIIYRMWVEPDKIVPCSEALLAEISVVRDPDYNSNKGSAM